MCLRSLPELPHRRYQSHSKNHDTAVVRQRDAVHNLAAVEIQRIAKDMKRAVICVPIATNAIRHARGSRFPVESCMRIPVAQALSEGGRRPIGVRHGESLRLL